ncbi:ATP-dependent OLD family endonuclease [Propionibacterium freudenreichii]|nr:ATP-dependent OLD family endonuclease [Propionibacterium freudenreichii]
MRVESATVSNFRCVIDSGQFDVEPDKTILVGINEAGKTALLKALQHASPTDDTATIDWLFDAPASMVDDIRRKNLDPATLAVARVVMRPEPKDLTGLSLPEGSDDVRLIMTAWMNGKRTYTVTGIPSAPTVGDAEKAILRLTGAMNKQSDEEAKQAAKAMLDWKDAQASDAAISGEVAAKLKTHLDAALPLFAEGSAAETHWDALSDTLKSALTLDKIGKHLAGRMPPFVYYSSYFAVRPRIHLNRLAEREASGEIDLEYDFGNLQLLKFLGFTAKELSDMASEAPEKGRNYDNDVNVQNQYKKELAAHERRVTERKRALQTAGARLTEEIQRVWNDDKLTIRLDVDGQYLQTLVEDELGIPVELDQRSEGFRWLVSFFVVFHAQAKDDLKDAILLLDEPGLSLHALKQQEFRKTVSRLAEGNQAHRIPGCRRGLKPPAPSRDRAMQCVRSWKPRADPWGCLSLPLVASVGPLLAPGRSKNASTSLARRRRARPRRACSSRPSGIAVRRTSMTACISGFPSVRSGRRRARQASMSA